MRYYPLNDWPKRCVQAIGLGVSVNEAVMSFPLPGSKPRSSAAFTLVEIMIVVVIIGLLAALAIPAFKRNQRASQNARVVSDFRVFTQAFEIYNSQNGTWPNNASPGQIPSAPVSMSGDFRAATWQAITAVGGRWNWDKDIVPGVAAGVSISNFTCELAQLAEIDAKLDDGNLATGLFLLTQPARVTLVLEAD